ncbi:unnamed protein product [Polarella glacialis]|uniref:Uncharacterized protein n=1 Tax=Polarella glacialis TaxID=89957 RepID=A0A813GHB6_POLGL|nr:unnamed protein product [Polarella glacialis]
MFFAGPLCSPGLLGSCAAPHCRQAASGLWTVPSRRVRAVSRRRNWAPAVTVAAAAAAAGCGASVKKVARRPRKKPSADSATCCDKPGTKARGRPRKARTLPPKTSLKEKAALALELSGSLGTTEQQLPVPAAPKLRARQLPKLHPQGGDIFQGAVSGIPELDERVRAVPGEVTVLDVSGSPGEMEMAATALALAWVDGLARKANWHFRILSDHSKPEALMHLLLHLSSGRENAGAEVIRILEHFRIAAVEPSAPLADGLDDEDSRMNSCSSCRGVVLIRSESVDKDDDELEQKEAVRLVRRARQTGAHVWVVRLWDDSRSGMDHLKDCCDNYVTLSAEALSSPSLHAECSAAHGLRVSVSKVRNRAAGEGDRPPVTLQLPPLPR